MKKNIILLILLLPLTGCTINYNLEFNGKRIKESINGTVLYDEIEVQDNSTGVNVYRDLLYNEQKVFENKNDVYTKNITSSGNIINYDFSYTYFNNYAESRIIKNCFSNSSVVETDDFYIINLTGRFNCLFSDQVVINVTSDYSVIDNNANIVKNNKYTWLIDSEDNVDISMTVSKNIKYIREEKTTINVFKIVCFVVLLALSSLTYFLYKRKNNNKN